MPPHGVGAHLDEGVCNGDIIVDGVQVCPAEPDPKCVAFGTYLDSC